AQRSSCDNALEIVQQDDEWDPIASEPLLEEQRFRQMRLRSGTEQDDFRAAFLQQAVERFERVTGTDQQQAWVSSDELLELPPRPSSATWTMPSAATPTSPPGWPTAITSSPTCNGTSRS